MTSQLKNGFQGLIAAVFTPLHSDGSLRLAQVPTLVDHLVAQGVTGIFVCGSTGEGPLLSSAERRRVAEAYVTAAKGRLRTIVHVGHDSLAEASGLAEHAAGIGADAIAALPPGYFRCDSVDSLINWLGEISRHAPSLPLYYYHIPTMSGHSFDVAELLEKASTALPALKGIKYSATDLAKLHQCIEISKGRYDLYFGVDEMLLGAVAIGANGAVGSTYNFAAPLYLEMIQAYCAGDVDHARRLQARAVQMVSIFSRYRGLPAIKATMKLAGIDCGPNRLPLRTLTAGELEQLKAELIQLELLS